MTSAGGRRRYSAEVLAQTSESPSFGKQLQINLAGTQRLCVGGAYRCERCNNMGQISGVPDGNKTPMSLADDYSEPNVTPKWDSQNETWAKTNDLIHAAQHVIL